MSHVLTLLTSYILPLFVMGVLLFGLSKKIPIYQVFIRGGREGIKIILEIIPCLVAMFVAIEVLQVSKTIDYLLLLLEPLMSLLRIPVEILPLAIMRTLSGSGSQALLHEIFVNHGVDSYLGRVASVLYGSTETTFYILTVYFGAIHIRRQRHALVSGLFADLIGFLAAILITTILLGS